MIASAQNFQFHFCHTKDFPAAACSHKSEGFLKYSLTRKIIKLALLRLIEGFIICSR